MVQWLIILNWNVKKAKELIIDFRRNPELIPDLLINGEKVETLLEYKYLGTILDHKLSFDSNTRAIQKKGQSRIYCLQKVSSFGGRQLVLARFFRCFIQSVLTLGFLRWFGGLGGKNRNVLLRTINVCGRVVGDRQVNINMLYEGPSSEKGVDDCEGPQPHIGSILPVPSFWSEI